MLRVFVPGFNKKKFVSGVFLSLLVGVLWGSSGCHDRDRNTFNLSGTSPNVSPVFLDRQLIILGVFNELDRNFEVLRGNIRTYEFRTQLVSSNEKDVFQNLQGDPNSIRMLNETGNRIRFFNNPTNGGETNGNQSILAESETLVFFGDEWRPTLGYRPDGGVFFAINFRQRKNRALYFGSIKGDYRVTLPQNCIRTYGSGAPRFLIERLDVSSPNQDVLAVISEGRSYGEVRINFNPTGTAASVEFDLLLVPVGNGC